MSVYVRKTKNDKELRQRHAAGGKTRKGVRIEPGPGDVVSQFGHRIPPKYKGTRHYARNVKIVQALESGQSAEKVAEKFGLAAQTVREIRRLHPPTP